MQTQTQGSQCDRISCHKEVPTITLLSGGLYFISSIADCTSSDMATNIIDSDNNGGFPIPMTEKQTEDQRALDICGHSFPNGII